MFFILLLAAVIGGVSAQSLRGKTVYIAVKSVAVKSSTGFFAGNRGTLQMGASVTVLQEKGKWVEIRSSNLTGWVAASSVTTKRVTGSVVSTASQREVAMAGKGFNQEIEDAYKQNGELDYAAIDAIEAQTVPVDELKRFLEEGRLALGE
jgi:uncharacterized protein YraI